MGKNNQEQLAKEVEALHQTEKIAGEEVQAELTQKEKDLAAAAEMRKSLNDAKSVLFDFQATDAFAALADNVKEAIKRLMKKAVSVTGINTTQGFLSSLFPSVGFELDEFELFKATKMGRGEMQKKVLYAMRKVATPGETMWIRFDKKKEAWILDAIGADMPGNWTEKMLPQTRG